MSHNYLTIITTICEGKEEKLRGLLRGIADPDYDARTFLRCKPEFRFDKLAGLHFCSFVILGGDDAFQPCLVFEATFDGSKTDFIYALLQIAGPGMDKIYRHCEGYPASGLLLPNIFEEYLLHHDVGAHAFFSGCPGRPVGQIVAENRLRSEMIDHLGKMRQHPGAESTTLNGVREQLQAEMISHMPQAEWAEQAAAVPDGVRFGRPRFVLGALALLGLLSMVVALGLWWLGLTASDVYAAIARWYQYPSLHSALVERVPGLQPLRAWVQRVDAAVPAALGTLLGLWLVLRFLEVVVFPLSEDPSEQSFLLRFGLIFILILRYGVLVFLIGFAIVALGAVAQSAGDPSPGVSPTLATLTKIELDLRYSWLRTLGVLGGCAAVFALLRYWETSLKIAVELQQLDSLWENFRGYLLDIVRLGMLVTVWIAALAVVAYVPASFTTNSMRYMAPFVNGVLVVAFYVLATLFLLLALIFLVSRVVRVLELLDRRRYGSAHELTSRTFNNTPAYAREEVGVNRHQNHLASLTQVKPGVTRRWLLSVTLYIVSFLTRLWFNRGDLDGIPTILSARWVMIDGGRRLLFLDNYGGPWDSYLNQFIDLGAVIGVNAIWTHTFIKAGADGKSFAFPDTDYLLWRGAQAEKPFKAYVRQSQVETIAWYSAYPKLSITNINANTELRQSLFKPQASSELDAFFQKL